MKKNKKWLSVVLAAVMAFSTLTVAFTAFAATPEDITTMNDRLAAATAVDESLNADLKAMGEDKDQLDPWYLMAYYRKVAQSVSNDKTAVENALGFTAAMNSYSTLYTTIPDMFSVTKQDLVAALKAAGKTAATYYLLGDHVSSSAAGTNFFGKVIAAPSCYTFDQIYNRFSGNAWPLPAETWADFKAEDMVSDYLVKAIDDIGIINEANIAFEKGDITSDDYLAQVEAVTVHPIANALSNFPFDNFFKNGAQDVSIQTVLNTYQETLEKAKYESFLSVLAQVDLAQAGTAAFNKSVEALIVSYNGLSDAYKGSALRALNEEAFNKAYDAFGQYTGKKVVPGLHETFTKEDPSAGPLEDLMSATVEPAVRNLISDLLTQLLGSDDLNAVLNAQLTNQNVTYLLATIYNMLSSLDLGEGVPISLTFSPTDVAGLLTEDRYADVKAALSSQIPAVPSVYDCPAGDFHEGTKAEVDAHIMAALYAELGAGEYAGPHNLNGTMAPVAAVLVTEGTPAETIYKTWDDVLAALDNGTDENLTKWGVTEGNFNSFAEAMVAGIRSLTNAIGIILPFTNVTTVDREGNVNVTYGAYENVVIPLFEAFGVTDIMTSEEYSAQYNKIGFATGNSDMLLLPVLEDLYAKVLQPLMADPLTFLLEKLPNLAYHLEDGCLTNGIYNAVASIGFGLADQPIFQNFGLESIIKMILNAVNGAADISAPLSEADQATADLIYSVIKKLGQAGTPVVVPSASSVYQTTVLVQANKNEVLNYLVDILGQVVGDLTGVTIDFAVKGEFVKVEAPAYPHNGKMGKDVMKAMIEGIDSLIGSFVNINDMLNSSVFTQKMAADAITGIYSLLDNETVASVLGLLNVSFAPSDVAAMLPEAKYADVKEALTFQNKNDDLWKNVAFYTMNDNGAFVGSRTDMGFKDGDRQGFLDCLTAALRPLVKAIAPILVNTDGQNAVMGVYETIVVPLFEAVGLTPATNSATFTSNYNKLLLANENNAYDYLVATILAPVVDLLDRVAAAPVATVMALLPNLAYAIQYTPELAFVGNLLDSMGGLAGLLNGLIQGIQTGESVDGAAIYGLKNFVLPEFPLDALASAGALKTDATSKSLLHKTYTSVVPDTADAFVTVFYYLYDAMNHQDNMQTVKNLLGGIEGLDPTLQGLIDNVLNEVFTKGKEEALCKLGTLLASDLWECPDEADNTGDKTPSTGDYSVPAIAFIGVMFAAGAAIIVLRKKKVTE